MLIGHFDEGDWDVESIWQKLCFSSAGAQGSSVTGQELKMVGVAH